MAPIKLICNSDLSGIKCQKLWGYTYLECLQNDWYVKYVKQKKFMLNFLAAWTIEPHNIPQTKSYSVLCPLLYSKYPKCKEISAPFSSNKYGNGQLLDAAPYFFESMSLSHRINLILNCIWSVLTDFTARRSNLHHIKCFSAI